MSDVDYYKNMMKTGETTDYTGGEFLGEQAAAHRTKTTKKKYGSQMERSGVQPDDWLGASPGKARRSYVIKEKKVVVPHVDSDEEEKGEAAPVKKEEPAVVSPAKEETNKAEEKTEVDPEIAKYKAMMHRDEGNDYATNEFLGEQAAANRTKTTKKKWGSQVDRSGTQPDDWLGSPRKGRKSYVIKEKKSTPAPEVVEDDKPAETTTASPAPAPAPEPKKEEDPEIAKYKAMMHRDEGNDYATNEFLGDQAAAHRTKTTKKKWGSQVDRSGTQPDDWLGSPRKGHKSYVIKEKKSTPAPAPEVHEEPKKEEPKVEESTPAPAPAPEPKKEEDPEIAKYKAMMHRDEGNDYATNEFLGEQAAANRTKTTKKKWGSQVDRSGTQPDDWLGSPRKGRKSYVIKEKKSTPAPAPEVHEEPKKEEPKVEESAPAPAPEPTPEPEPKKEEDPEIAKYKAMMHRDEGNDYATNEFLGEQAAANRTKTSKKKWGSQVDRSGTQPDDWLGASPGKARKSYVIKEKKSTPAPAPEVHETATKEETFMQEQTNTAFSVKKKEEEPAKKEEDPEIAKYKAMMHRDEGNDYATNEFLGEQAAANRTKSPKKKKWGSPVGRVNDDWLGGGGTTRKSYTIKGSSSSAHKPPFSAGSPTATRASFSPVASPRMTSPKAANGGFSSPVSQKERMAGRASFSAAMNSLSSPKITSPRTSLTHESPVSEKERTAGRKSFSAAFDKFKKSDTSVPAAFAHASHVSPTGRNFHVNKEAQLREKLAHHHDEEHHEPTIQEERATTLDEEHKKEFDEALQMLNKIFIRLDDREASWKQMDAVIKKIGKATKQGADIKAILSYSITSLQHIAGLLYDEDQNDTDDVVEKLIDLNMNL